MCVHSDAVAAQQRTAKDAVISSAVSFIHSDYHQSAFCCFDVLDGTVFDLLTICEQKRDEPKKKSINDRVKRKEYKFTMSAEYLTWNKRLPSFFLGVMIPLHLLALQHLGDFKETTKVHTLPVCDHHLLLEHARVTYIVRVVANIL